MNSGCIFGGAFLMLISVFFTILTFGFGIVCTGPLFFIGFIIFVIGFFITENIKKEVYHYYPTQSSSISSNRYCPNCGCNVPIDSSFCQYCGLKLHDYTSSTLKSLYCTKCGFENKPDANFCKNCGKKL